MIGLLRRPAFEAPCRIAVAQTGSAFHAHVELDGDIAIGPGDKVQVHGAPITVPFGQDAVYRRIATVQPAGPLLRAWTRFAAHFDLTELFEVSFTTRRF